VNILIIGSGGREHALAWKIAQDERVSQVFIAPGNAGTASEAKCQNIAIDVLALEPLADFVEQNQVGLTIVGPEAPLVAGVVDLFTSRGLPIFGPTAAAAQLEGSKAFAKDFLSRHHIPTAFYQVFTEVEPALAYVRQQGAPIVIKADGLAAGKGVIVAMTLSEAEAAVRDMLQSNSFGQAGARVVIEEFLSGEEASFIVMADGTNALPFASSQDHKRAFDADQGPNTGGMGAYSPAPVVTPEVEQRVMDEIIRPTLAGMAKDGHPYRGFLYAGLMIDQSGAAKVIEYNCRLGDPETQPLLMRLNSSLLDLVQAALDGQLDKIQAQWNPQPALGVVLAANGYPGDYAKGGLIEGLDNAVCENGKVFHAGTALKNGKVCINGGRVLCATALGETVASAQHNAYQLAAHIYCQDLFCRKDIGSRAIVREQSH